MKQKLREYFAAANGFTGFRSYFGETFYDKNTLAVFIVKGGPGTGKSSLMKRVLKDFLQKGYACDAVYCSSDPASLDGVIIGGRVAIFDGTAPHEMDTRLPGALDEIINLGEGWNSDFLKKERFKIEEINKIKKQNYNSAYKYLSFSGNIHDFKIKLLKKIFAYDECERLISRLLEALAPERKSNKRILISAFSKHGFTRRDLSGFEIKKYFSINGTYGEEEIFFEALSKRLASDYSYIKIPSPFSDEITEGVYFEKEKIMFISNYNEGEIINASEFLQRGVDAEIEFLDRIEKMHLEKSKDFFKEAADAHFKLEDIYKNAMNFSKNEEIYEKLSQKLMKILSY